VKLLDSDLHQEHTGAPNSVILENLKALAAAGRHVIVRYPLIPGVNDTAAALSGLAGCLNSFGLRRLDLLPYHRIGMDKYKRLGLPGPSKDIAIHSPAQVSEIAATLRGEGLEVGVGGNA